MSLKKKSVLFISPRPNLGGASQVLLNLLSATNPADTLNVSFLFEEMGVSLSEYQRYGSSHVFPLEKKPLLRKIFRKLSARLYDYAKYWYARWIIQTQTPQLIYINSLTSSPSVCAALRTSIPVLLHAHEMDFLVVFKLPDVWIRNTLDRIDQLIACSNAVATFYEHTFGVSPTKISVVHGPVSSERLFKKAKSLPTASQHNDKTIVIGTVANLSFLKAPDTVIEALRILINEKVWAKGVEFRWLGAPARPNPYFSSLLELVKKYGLENYISFLPASSQTAEFYSGIDIFVLPSRIEAFPLSILEAMLFEKPVVAMDVGGVREVVDAETGYLVKDRTPEGLAEGIRYFVEDAELRHQTGKNGRQRVLANFEARIQAPKWLKILEDL